MRLKSIRFLFIFALIAVTGIFMFKRFEESMVFFPEKYPAGKWEFGSQDTIVPVDYYFEDENANKLHGWFFSHEGAKTTLLFFHGNAGNLSGRYDWACDLNRLGINVFIIDYPGYGRSQGRPGEAALYQSADASLKFLETDLGLLRESIIVYGKSLGGVPAAYLAENYGNFKGLILQSTFTNAKDMSSRVLPLPMIDKLLSLKLDTLGRLSRIKLPVMMIHSRDDEMIPFEMAERLYAAASYPKYLKLFDGAGHNDLIHVHRHKLLLDFKVFIEKHNGETEK